MKIQISSRRTALFCFFLLLLGTSPAVAQKAANQDPQSLNYGFVSPNTRDGLKLDDAIRGMNSAEETSLLIRAKGMGCVVKRRITTTPALGSWSDGAEHSIMLRVYTDQATIRYLMSRLGRDANQKAILYFHPEPSGSAKIYLMHLRRGSRGFDTVAQTLDNAGVLFRDFIFSFRRLRQLDTHCIAATRPPRNAAPGIRAGIAAAGGRIAPTCELNAPSIRL